MKITTKSSTSTSKVYEATFDAKDLKDHKKHALNHIAEDIKIPGFRKGKAPANAIEKEIDANLMQQKFLEIAVPHLVGAILDAEDQATALPPSVNITAFVPYETLTMELTCEFVGKVDMPDYKKIKVSMPDFKATDEDIDNVLKRIQLDMAERKDVDRKAKDDDQVWIDFDGFDTKGKPVEGASGKDYPLVLGSKTFIPGFEENVVGLKKDDEKTFTLEFPKDYGVATLAGAKVTFKITVSKVQELNIPKIDDDLAKKIGPYAGKKELLADVKKQIEVDKANKAGLQAESELMDKLVDGTKADVPDGLVEGQLERILTDHKANLAYKGQSYSDWLKAEKLTEETHKATLMDEANRRLIGGIVLSEVAKKEGIEVKTEEIDEAINGYKAQYKSDDEMMKNLASPEGRRDVAARILTDRTLNKLRELCIK